MRRRYCEPCHGKRIYLNKFQARDGMGGMLSRRENARPADYALTVYECPHGNGFHFGHKPETIAIFKNMGVSV